MSGYEVFQGEGVIDLARVERELQNLWKQAAEDVVLRKQPPVTHVSTVNLVALTRGREEAERASQQAIELSASHPGRVLIIQEEQGADSLSASISAHCHLGGGNRQICSEMVHLIASGRRFETIAQSVAPLMIPDLPTVLWIPGDPLALTVPPELTELSDRIIVDSHNFTDTQAALQHLNRWCDKDDAKRLSDLAWIRLERWRSLTSQMFDEPAARRDLDQLERIEVDYLTSRQGAPEGRLEALYYVAWVASQLGFETVEQRPGNGERKHFVLVHPGGRRLEIKTNPLPRQGDAPGDLMRVCLIAGKDGCRYEIERQSNREVATLQVQAKRSCPLPTQVGFVSQDVLSSLSAAMDRHQSDPVFRRVIHAAFLMTGTP